MCLSSQSSTIVYFPGFVFLVTLMSRFLPLLIRIGRGSIFELMTRASPRDQGAAFIEIYQNCPIFNDDAFAPLKDAASRDDQLIRLADGEPIRFGAGRQRGLRAGRYGGLEAVDAADADGESLLVHDAGREEPSYAFGLSRLDGAHTPIGVFRQVERPSYDALMAQQVRETQTKQGPGDLAGLLASGDTWTIR